MCRRDHRDSGYVHLPAQRKKEVDGERGGKVLGEAVEAKRGGKKERGKCCPKD